MNRLVLGIGNILMADDGVGVHVARELEPEADSLGVRIEDGGTAGLALIDWFEPHDEILVVDAANFGAAPGTTAIISPELLCARRAWSGHDHGLVDVLRLLEIFPAQKHIRILGVQPARVDHSTHLSPELSAAFSDILDDVRREAIANWKIKGVMEHA